MQFLYSFPSQPVLRNRGYYDKDKENEKAKKYKEKNRQKNPEETEGLDTCRKSFRGHRSLMAGIFTVYCQHGKLTIYLIKAASITITPYVLFCEQRSEKLEPSDF